MARNTRHQEVCPICGCSQLPMRVLRTALVLLLLHPDAQRWMIRTTVLPRRYHHPSLCRSDGRTLAALESRATAAAVTMTTNSPQRACLLRPSLSKPCHAECTGRSSVSAHRRPHRPRRRLPPAGTNRRPSPPRPAPRPRRFQRRSLRLPRTLSTRLLVRQPSSPMHHQPLPRLPWIFSTPPTAAVPS